MKRLLFIAHRVPYPPDKGDRLRAFHEIKALSEHFHITLAALAHGRGDHQAAGALAQWCEKVIVAPAGGTLGLIRGALCLLTGGSVTEGYFSSRRLRKLIAAEAARESFDLVVAYSSSTLPYALAAPAAARMIDLVDVDSAKWASYADEAPWPVSWLYRREASGVRALERQAVEHCDAVLLVSEAETAALPSAGEQVVAIGNGVDTEFFAPGAAAPVDRGRPGLVFTGQMDYRPNVDGVCWFVRHVWPQLRRDLPDLTFTVVGRNPARAVRQLAKLPGVEVTGPVADVRPYLAAADAAICPLRIARGVQNKVLEAMAMGRAVVASPPALEGLDVEVGREVLQADTPAQWQSAIRDIVADEALRSRLGRSARARIEAKYQWASRMAPLVRLCLREATSKAAAEAPAEDGTSSARAGAQPVGLAAAREGVPR